MAGYGINNVIGAVAGIATNLLSTPNSTTVGSERAEGVNLAASMMLGAARRDRDVDFYESSRPLTKRQKRRLRGKSK